MILGLVLCLAVAGWAQDAAPAAADTPPAAPAAKSLSLWDLIKQGGWAMWPLGLCSFTLIAMAVMNFLMISPKKMMPPEIVGQLRAAARNKDIGQAWTLATSISTLFTDALAAGLRHIDPEDPAASKPKMEEATAEAVARQESIAGFWINFLSLIAGIAPMLGLLGTVSGMIGAFQKISAGGMGKPELLAGNIGEALITTAAGLIIAIPAMFFYFLFRNLLNRIIIRAEENFSIIFDELTGTGIEVAYEEEETPAAG